MLSVDSLKYHCFSK